jgi:hypothetical protein
VKTEVYTGILRRLRDEVKKKKPRKMEKPGVGFYFTTMLQHTGFLSEKQRNKTVASPILT